MFEPRDPNFETRVRASFAAQSAMKSLQIQLLSLQPGVTMRLEKSDHLLQQQGFMHGGVLTAGLDGACGFAALTLSRHLLRCYPSNLKHLFPTCDNRQGSGDWPGYQVEKFAFARLRPLAWKMTLKFCWQKCRHLLRWLICQKAGYRKTKLKEFQRGGIRIAPSSRIVSPFSISFQLYGLQVWQISGCPSRLGNGLCR